MVKKVLERDVEKYFVSEVERIGGEVRKCQWVGRNHAPDRVVFYAGVYFVELKRPKASAREGQAREHKRLRRQGADVRVVDTRKGVNIFISEIKENESKIYTERVSGNNNRPCQQHKA